MSVTHAACTSDLCPFPWSCASRGPDLPVTTPDFSVPPSPRWTFPVPYRHPPLVSLLSPFLSPARRGSLVPPIRPWGVFVCSTSPPLLTLVPCLVHPVPGPGSSPHVEIPLTDTVETQGWSGLGRAPGDRPPLFSQPPRIRPTVRRRRRFSPVRSPPPPTLSLGEVTR